MDSGFRVLLRVFVRPGAHTSSPHAPAAQAVCPGEASLEEPVFPTGEEFS